MPFKKARRVNFPRLRRTGAELQRAAVNGARDLDAAVAVEFCDVLPREGMRRAETDAHAEIGERAAVNLAGIHAVRLELPLMGKHISGERESPFPAHTNDGDAAGALCRCNGRN